MFGGKGDDADIAPQQKICECNHYRRFYVRERSSDENTGQHMKSHHQQRVIPESARVPGYHVDWATISAGIHLMAVVGSGKDDEDEASDEDEDDEESEETTVRSSYI